jgi:hypothetical protein
MKMKKFRPEVINFRMQLGYPDSDNNKCDGQPVLHLIILCSEDEERDHDLLHDEDVQGMKDVACCYYQRTFYGSGFEIMPKLTTTIPEWLMNNTQLPVSFCLELLSIIMDKYKDLKDRVETSVYINNMGINYIDVIPELSIEVRDIMAKHTNKIITTENLNMFKHELMGALYRYNVDLYPILTAHDSTCDVDFRTRDRDVVIKHKKYVLQDN